MREVELKAVVEDAAGKQRLLELAGATLLFEGILQDRRYDTEAGALADKDEVIRVRTYSGKPASTVQFDWKGPTDTSTGYKVREEISIDVSNGASLATILDKLGFIVVREIDRRIAQYAVDGATVRFEVYPRMDTLVEVEGDPEAIERVIELLRMSRGEFSSEALTAFVARFERRTGVRAATSDRELGGRY
ncbi:MAG: class IV adenylate cyclase [Gemmatimonadota bacterium]|nr:class IV adenylate cyclase [Gemmatimonadota bacterium]